jgi:hypothetical protein
MDSKKKYVKHETPEDALNAIKESRKRYYEQHKYVYGAKEREKYRLAHPNHKIYSKREIIEYTTCQSKTALGGECTRKIKSGETYCWQHNR